MSSPSYLVPGLTLSMSTTFSTQAQDLQRDLRALGYFAGPIDGIFGHDTHNCVMALQHDLMNNTGTGKDGNAPVAIQSYNNGAVTAATGDVDQGTAACIAAMLNDANYPKIPASSNPADDNARALAAAQEAAAGKVPMPFLLQILAQESSQKHYQVPAGSSVDSFVTIGLDRNDAANPTAISSRGYGIGQVTLYHHPPTSDEVNGLISDPLLNVAGTVALFRSKFDEYVNGPADTADERIQEVGTGALRECKYPAGDPMRMNDCANCCKAAGTFDIVAGVTPVYAGSAVTYNLTKYHKGSYANVPVRANIPCDWPYAIRRYNGIGVNSYDYQAEVLLRIAQ